jgi:hypothetical protein
MSAVLSRTPAMLTVTITRGTEAAMNDALSEADAWIADHAPEGAEPIGCVDHGDTITWLFAA